MNRIIKLLSGILVVQLLLALFLGINNFELNNVASSSALLNFAIKEVDRITIEQPNKTSLVINRRGEQWLLPTLNDFPAFTSKVNGFIDHLAGLKKRFPVSTSPIAVRRFKVSPAIYEHKIMLSAGDRLLATLWLGDSPGMRQVHGRVNEETDVYNLDFAVYEVTTDPNQWADKTVLNLKPDDLTQIVLPNLKLIKVRQQADQDNQTNAAQAKPDNPPSSKWQIANLAPDETLNNEEIENLINRIANLSFEAVLGKDPQANYQQDKPLFNLSVTVKAGETHNYVFSQLTQPANNTESDKKDNNADKKLIEYVLKTSASPYYFKLAEFMVKPLLEIKRDKLIKSTKTDKNANDKSEPAPVTLPSTPVEPVIETPPTVSDPSATAPNNQSEMQQQP